LKTFPNNIEADVASASDFPITAIRGMSSGMDMDVPNDDEVAQAADHVVSLKACARVASVKHARKVSLGDL